MKSMIALGRLWGELGKPTASQWRWGRGMGLGRGGRGSESSDWQSSASPSESSWAFPNHFAL